MKIRSITSFYDPNSPSAQDELKTLASLSQKLQSRISDTGLAVQSTRVATTPFPHFLPIDSEKSFLSEVQNLEKESLNMGWSYISLGPALPANPRSYAVIPQALGETEHVFFGAVISDESHIYPQAVKHSAEIILKNAKLAAEGFTNLRFAALANVLPMAPFLPAAYHQPGAGPAISFAIECADVILNAFSTSNSFETARKEILNEFETAAQQITSIFNTHAGKTGISLAGFDFSPAPFPIDQCSLGAAVEEVGLEHIGGIGSLAAIAFIADTLDRGNWKKAGFNGMMLALLEDSRLAQRAAEGHLGIKDLLLYSTVCGTGLDTIPLNGDVSADELTSVLMDVAALATRLGKPLTARLMPIPGKKAGDFTEFEFEFFSRSRILSIDGQRLKPLRFDQELINISPRGRGK